VFISVNAEIYFGIGRKFTLLLQVLQAKRQAHQTPGQDQGIGDIAKVPCSVPYQFPIDFLK